METGPTHDEWVNGVWKRDKALDIYNPPYAGEPILASADGSVYYNGPGGIKINHGGGWFTAYFHMANRIAAGTWVRKGQQIGTMSNVGTGAPHLHYEQLFDSNGDNLGRDGEWVHPVLHGVEYRLSNGQPYVAEAVSHNCPNPEVGRAHGVAVSGGKVFHTLRYADGSWTNWVSLDNGGTATSVSAAADGVGNTHVTAVIDGIIQHRIRYTDGSWTGWGSLGPGSQVSTSVDRRANVTHLAAVIGGVIHHRIRWTDGSWTGWEALGQGSQVAISVDHANNILQMSAIIGNTLHHRVRNSDGSWTPFYPIETGSTVSATALSADNNGNTQVAQVLNGTAYHRIRYADGSWSPWAPIATNATTITMAVDFTRNNLHAMTILNGTVHHRVRNTDGTWTNWHPFSPTNTTTHTAITVV